MKLSELVYSNLNIARSVNLERDSEKEDIIEDYHVTSKSLEILRRFVDALKGEKVSAWSLTGPYGMGKSAFVNYLFALSGPPNSRITRKAVKSLKSADPKLHKEFTYQRRVAGSQGFFRISVTAAYEPINDTLAQGLQKALSGCSDYDDLIEKLQIIERKKPINSQDIIDIIRELQGRVKRPLIVVVDEFGKNLDYMSHHHNKGDIFIMQQLAEMDHLYLWVCLHQAFDEYISGLSSLQRQEWSKVQGRFEDISFVESIPQMVSLIEKALKPKFNGQQEIKLNNWAKKAKIVVDRSNIPNKKDFDEKTIKEIYPVHPITAVTLVELCRRFAQNDRTLLSFMCSGDKYALPAYLENTEISEREELPAVGLDYLYDYFFNISVTAYMNRAESQRWVEIHNKIEDIGLLTRDEQIILKNIGVLNLLSKALGLKADLETLSELLDYSYDFDKEKSAKMINALVNRRVLLYRDYAKEYRLWEGSDFDIKEAIKEQKNKIAVGSLDRILEKYLQLSPVIASRHAYKTGTVRRFERRWLDVEHLTDDLAPQKGYDGLFLYCFGSAPALKGVPESCSDGRPLIIAYVPSQANLHEFAMEVAAARSVLENYPQLEHDSVAKKEIRFRIKVAEEQFREYLNQLYLPGSENLTWYCEGKESEINSSRKLSEKLSDLCDSYYYNCPYIGNEMINYDKISGAAARARRELVEAMVDNASKEQLGLKGFGPEVALYRSLILAEGLHERNNETGFCKLSLETDSKLRNLWGEIDELMNNNYAEGVTVADIIQELQNPPYGMRLGPAPIYICLYLLVNSNDVALFQEDTYKPYFTSSDLALMLKRPELFSIKKIVSNKVEREVFDTYQGILNSTQIEDNKGLRNVTLLSVVGPLIKFVEALPDYTKNTKKISKEAKKVLSAIQNSTEPMRLLFEEIPEAVGAEINSGNYNDLQANLCSALEELGQAYPNLIQKIKEAMLSVFNYENIEELYKSQQERIKQMVDVCHETELRAVMKAFLREMEDIDEWVKGIAGIVSKKPVKSWDDNDLIAFTAKMKDYADQMEQLQALTSLSSNYLQRDTRLLSIMTPDGNVRREIIYMNGHDQDVQDKVSELLEMPAEKRKSILIALADKLCGGESND